MIILEKRKKLLLKPKKAKIINDCPYIKLADNMQNYSVGQDVIKWAFRYSVDESKSEITFLEEK